jgi:hypothetical protein
MTELNLISLLTGFSGVSPSRDELKDILDQNKEWARNVRKKDPSFFKTLAEGQSPKILWFGMFSRGSLLLTVSLLDVFRLF